MPRSKVTTDTTMMKNDIRELEELLVVIKSSMQNIRHEITELNVMWEGSAKTTFNNQFQQDYITLEEVMKNLSGMMDSMKLAEREYVKCEESISDIIKSINI